MARLLVLASLILAVALSRTVDKKIKPVPRIVNGDDASVGDFPFIVREQSIRRISPNISLQSVPTPCKTFVDELHISCRR